LIPLQETAVRDAVIAALYGRSEPKPRPYSDDLVDCLYDEAVIAVDLFSPELGYLTSGPELERAAEEAVAAVLLDIRLTLARRFAHELVTVRPPEFVPPQRGDWIAQKDSRGQVSTWHRASGNLQSARAPGMWPGISSLCGHRLQAMWRDDGSPIFSILRAGVEPRERACRKCASRP